MTGGLVTLGKIDGQQVAMALGDLSGNMAAEAMNRPLLVAGVIPGRPNRAGECNYKAGSESLPNSRMFLPFQTGETPRVTAAPHFVTPVTLNIILLILAGKSRLLSICKVSL